MDDQEWLAERFEEHRPHLRAVVDAFLAAAREGDLEALVAVLDSEVAGHARPVLVNGAAGLVGAPPGRLTSVLGFTVRGGRIVEIDILADPGRLGQLDLAVLDG